MAQRMENREKMRQDIIAQAAGDLGTQEEENLKKSLAVNKITQSKIQEDSKEHRRKIDVYESAFRKIKEATGVSDVNEVIQKIVSQEDTQNNLMELTRENQAKIEAMNEEKARLKSRVEEIKYSGPGGGHRRKMVDDHEENLTQSAAKLERCRLKYERLAKILINVKAGIEHLSEKLESVREDGKQIAMNDDTIVDVMYQCEQTLYSILQRIADSGMETKPSSDSAVDISDNEVLASRPYNQRIQLPTVDENPGGLGLAGMIGGDDGDDMGLDEDGEEELTRDKVKKASASLVVSHERRNKKKGKRSKKKGASKGRRSRVV